MLGTAAVVGSMVFIVSLLDRPADCPVTGSMVRTTIAPYTNGSRDSMSPSVTSGATMGSAASRRYPKLERHLSAIMTFLPGNLG